MVDGRKRPATKYSIASFLYHTHPQRIRSLKSITTGFQRPVRGHTSQTPCAERIAAVFQAQTLLLRVQVVGLKPKKMLYFKIRHL